MHQIIIVVFASLASAQIVSDQPCPKLAVIQHFDLHKVSIQVIWYRNSCNDQLVDDKFVIYGFISSSFFGKQRSFISFFAVPRLVVRNWKLSSRLQFVEKLRYGQLFLAAGWQCSSHQPQFQHEVQTLRYIVVTLIGVRPCCKCWCIYQRVSTCFFPRFNASGRTPNFWDSPSTRVILDQVLTSMELV